MEFAAKKNCPADLHILRYNHQLSSKLSVRLVRKYFTKQTKRSDILIFILHIDWLIVQSNVEFINDNDTNILFNFNDELILQQDLRIEGSTSDQLAIYSTEEVTKVTLQNTMQSTINSSLPTVSDDSSMVTDITILTSGAPDGPASMSQHDTSSHIFTSGKQ
ncbi:unnamed protein product [Rotaria sp. Silwood2]|nr:unnamed protein product [Rotaria sp. Silwood2]